MLYVETGKRIRELRLARKIKQKDLARAIGMAPSSLSELESGASKEPSGPALAALCRTLKVNQDWLLTGRGDPALHTPLDSATSELASIWDQLPDEGRAALMAAARAMRDSYKG